jgi:hypothetical protein
VKSATSSTNLHSAVAGGVEPDQVANLLRRGRTDEDVGCAIEVVVAGVERGSLIAMGECFTDDLPPWKVNVSSSSIG